MSVNKWFGIGNLTKDPELRYSAAGTAVCNFSIACNERFKDKDGNRQEKVEYINIVCWRQLAEICGKYLVKGKQIYVEGKLQTRRWEDRDGNTRYSTEIVADLMQMLGGKGDSHASTNERPAQSQSAPQNANIAPKFDPMEDIPF